MNEIKRAIICSRTQYLCSLLDDSLFLSSMYSKVKVACVDFTMYSAMNTRVFFKNECEFGGVERRFIMALPRVFVSSTYYDLKQYRSIIGDFIRSLGYEPIMHERSGVTYTQNTPLEFDCYHEIESCDIVVCIIGNHFGTKSSENDISITMNELTKALKTKAKIYVFIANDVYIENRTYRMNKGSENFKSAYTDNIKIHEFITEIIDRENSIVIQPFSSTDEIINNLKLQWAGLFQNLLSREASQTETKTVYDLEESRVITPLPENLGFPE